MKVFFATFFSLSFVFLLALGINCVYGYVFPIKFQDEVFAASVSFDVKEEVIYSMINIESHFKNNVQSSKGALGLMQIMPGTAQYLAAELGMKEYDLTNPQDNILLGTYYISILYKRFGDLDTALAAYNAGPTKVSAWLKDDRYSDDGKTLKDFPFEETKNYVEKFHINKNYYSKNLKIN